MIAADLQEDTLVGKTIYIVILAAAWLVSGCHKHLSNRPEVVSPTNSLLQSDTNSWQQNQVNHASAPTNSP